MFSILRNRGKNKKKEEKKAKTDDGDVVMEDGTKQGQEEAAKVDHGLETAHLRFLLQCDESLLSEKKSVIEAKFMENIKAKYMVEYYKNACEHGLMKLDEKLVQDLVEKNKKEKKILEESEKDAQENHGEIEVMEALLDTANFRALTGTKQEALDAYDKVAALKSLSTGQLIDVYLKKILLGFFWMDTELVKLGIEKADKLLEKGGDWDRRNRLKVYRGLYSLATRDFVKASEDFLSAIATFTSSELCSYEVFIFYTVITGIIALDRVQFKKNIVDSPEVLAVVQSVPFLSDFMNSFYDCDYKKFFVSLVNLNSRICTDRYMVTHKDWFFREVRVLAYVQFLESYKSVTLDSMAKSFGVSTTFLDKELSHFISSRRINAKIDKVGGVIETCQPNEANSRYQSVIRQGDLLLNRVQMLSRAINV